jgi:ribonuclease HI
MIVTINTDASHSKLYNVGSYAFWIVSNQGKVAKSGLLKKHSQRPQESEFKCIINAFHCLISQRWDGVDKIIVNTDCLDVIHIMNNDVKKIKKYRLQWGNILRLKLLLQLKEAKMSKIPIEFRHIKSHVSTETPKQWVNDWCDKEAKTHIRKFLKTQVK